MEKVLVSACLMGKAVRYDGGALSLPSSLNDWLQQNVEWVGFCPEVAAGLPIPRAPAEIFGGHGDTVLQGEARVVGSDGIDVTTEFISGAQLALNLCRQHTIRYAVLAEGSPSCGSRRIYDGSFQGRKVAGMGVTAALLEQAGIRVFSQHTMEELKAALS